MTDQERTIFETPHWLVILSKDQALLGRCVIVCKDDAKTLSDLTDEQWIDFSVVVNKLEAAAIKTFGATMANWTCLMNNAYKNNPPDPLVHWHFRPRYKKAIQFGGQAFEDKEFGSHYGRGTERELDDKAMKQIVTAYKSVLY